MYLTLSSYLLACFMWTALFGWSWAFVIAPLATFVVMVLFFMCQVDGLIKFLLKRKRT